MTKKRLLESMFFTLLSLGVVAIANAQNEQAEDSQGPTHVKVEVEVTENGQTSSSVQEIQLDVDRWSKGLEAVMNEMEDNIRMAVKNIEGSAIEIVIRKELENLELPDLQTTISAIPNFQFKSESGDDYAFLGIEGSALNAIQQANTGLKSGVRISRVVPGSAAEAVGLQRGMIITAIDGKGINAFDELAEAIRNRAPKDEVKLDVYRNGKIQKQTVILGARKDRAPRIEMEWEDKAGSHRYVFPDRTASSHQHLADSIQDSSAIDFSYTIRIAEVNKEEVDHISLQSGELLDSGNSLKPKELTIGPNPSKGIFMLNLELEQPASITMKVFDVQGRKVYDKHSQVNEEGYFLTRIDLSDQSNGMYYLTIMQDGKGLTKRLIKH